MESGHNIAELLQVEDIVEFANRFHKTSIRLLLQHHTQITVYKKKTNYATAFANGDPHLKKCGRICIPH